MWSGLRCNGCDAFYQGCGIHAAKNTLKYVSFWCAFTFVVSIASFHGHAYGVILFFVWDGMQLLFYLALWLMPLNRLYRRPAGEKGREWECGRSLSCGTNHQSTPMVFLSCMLTPFLLCCVVLLDTAYPYARFWFWFRVMEITFYSLCESSLPLSLLCISCACCVVLSCACCVVLCCASLVHVVM
jgi:hypothetical protein